MPPRRRFRLTLEAIESEIPAYVRLRAALKSLRRRFGLRCTAVEEVREQRAAAKKAREASA